MARYTLDQILAMQAPERAWEQAGWTPLGWTTDDGQMMYSDPSGERQVTQSQLMSMMENGDFESGRNLLPQDVIAWNLQDGPQDWNWINQQYGTSFQNSRDYLNYLYGPGGEFIERGPMGDQWNAANATDYYVLPEGVTAPINAPLSYNPPDSGLTKWMPAILGGVALAGMGGLLPGTTSIFGGTPAFAGGASGGTIAGGASGGGALAGGGLTAAETAALGGATGGALSGAGGAAVSGATQGATSALGRILGGTATSDDWLSVLGGAGSSLLGVLGSNAQADAYGDVASQYLGLGAPFREKLLQSYAPGFSMADQPDFQNAMDIGAQAAARATSARVGNPVDNPGAYAEMQKYITGSLALPQLNTYRSQLGSFGQLGTNTAGTASMGEASQAGGMYNALGYGLGQLTRPQNQTNNALSQMLLNSGFSF